MRLTARGDSWVRAVLPSPAPSPEAGREGEGKGPGRLYKAGDKECDPGTIREEEGRELCLGVPDRRSGDNFEQHQEDLERPPGGDQPGAEGASDPDEQEEKGVKSDEAHQRVGVGRRMLPEQTVRGDDHDACHQAGEEEDEERPPFPRPRGTTLRSVRGLNSPEKMPQEGRAKSSETTSSPN